MCYNRVRGELMIKKITDFNLLHEDEKLSHLFSQCFYDPTAGKLKTTAQAIYGKSQGFCYVYYIENEPVSLLGGSEIDKGHFILKHAATLETHRRKGYARLLFDHAIESRGYKTVEAEAPEDSVPFFKHCGFRCKLIKNHPLDLVRYTCKYGQN